MKKLGIAAVVCAAMALGPLSASPAFAYPDPVLTIETNSPLVGGKTLEITAEAGGSDCAWNIVYEGQTESGNGESFSTTFSTEEVDEETDVSLTATCVYDDSTGPASAETPNGDSVVRNALYVPAESDALQAAVQSQSKTVQVTLLPEGDGDGDGNGDNDSNSGGLLPDTGGANLILIVLGAGLLATGASAVYVSRRRSHGAG